LACLVAPVICWFLDQNSKAWFGGYSFGNELLVLNGLFTFAALCAFPKKPVKQA
jgi:SSS family solute:Na+ symporter